MKKIYALLIILFAFKIQAQNKILFNYDNAGNQIKREICINCLTGKNVKDIKDLKKEDLTLSDVSDQISYYPNPVKEELYLSWELLNDTTISSIIVYSLNGQLLQSYKNTNKLNSQNISFKEYPQGIYAIVLTYNNGEQKSIKIIKK